MIDDYKDIIDLPYPRNDWNFLMKHPRMSVANRAKIFSPVTRLSSKIIPNHCILFINH